MVKKTYKVVGMHCTSCALVIESDLLDHGIKASCNYAKELLEVEFDEIKTIEDDIINVVHSAGYELS